MSAWLAERRKAVVNAAGVALLVLAPVVPLAHGTALNWLLLGIAVATAITHYATPNADKPDLPAGRNWTMPSNVSAAGPQVFRQRPDVPTVHDKDGPDSVGFPKT